MVANEGLDSGENLAIDIVEEIDPQQQDQCRSRARSRFAGGCVIRRWLLRDLHHVRG
jgi:hypothetical protein